MEANSRKWNQMPAKEVRAAIAAGETDWVDSLTPEEMKDVSNVYELITSRRPTEDELKETIKQWIREMGVNTALLKAELIKDNDKMSDINDQSTSDHSVISENPLKNQITMDFTKEYVYGVNDWRIFTEQMSQYFILTDIIDEKKKTALLLCRINEEAYRVLESLCSPDKPSTKTFQELTDLMEKEVNPWVNPCVLRAQFRARRQNADETGVEFIAALKKMITRCDFADKDQAMTDQIVEGLRSDELRKELMKEGELNMERAIEMVETDEAAELTSKMMKEKGKDRRKIKDEKRNWKEEICKCCGDVGHDSGRCYYRCNRCHECGKKGHLWVMCDKRGNEAFRQARKINRGVDDREDESDSEITDSSETSLNDTMEKWEQKQRLLEKNTAKGRKDEGIKTFIWKNASNGDVPLNALEGGEDCDGETLFVGRAYHGGALVPGKVKQSHGVCYVAWHGDEHAKNDYQVLCGSSGKWVPVTKGQRPPNGAVTAGETEDGEPLYVGRIPHEGTMTIGKVEATHACWIPYDGGEVTSHDYEVLIE